MSERLLFPAPNSAQRASLGLPKPLVGTGRSKVLLLPGHSPLDWANLNRTKKQELRGVPHNAPPPQYVKVPMEELKKHRAVDDCWTTINGKVFNITPYVDFHPGGRDEIMKCAGKDGTTLFNKYHSWVNVDRMLENCWIGVLDKRG